MIAVGRDRWLALGLLLAVTSGTYLLLVHPWWTVPMGQAGERIDMLEQRELRARMQLQQAPLVQQRLDAFRRQQSDHPGVLPETTPERASAWLVQRLESVVAEASPGNRSCAISSRSPLPPQQRERFPGIAVQVRMQCGVAQLAQVLHALENGSPRLFVDRLHIVAHAGAGLDASFELRGHIAPVGEVSVAR